MATQTLTLRTPTIGTLTAVQITSSLSAADVASINQGISDDQAIVSTSKGASAATIQSAVIFSGLTTTALASISVITNLTPSGVSVANSVRPGHFVYGVGIAPGTTVLSVSASGTVNLSSVPLAGGSSYFIVCGNRIPGCFSLQGYLNVPNRGVLKLLQGDVVATGPAGEVIVIPATALPAVYPGSLWVLT